MGCFARDTDRMSVGEHGIQINPIHRRTRRLHLLEGLRVRAERAFEFAGGNQLRQDCPAIAQADLLGQFAHEGEAFLFTHRFEHRAEPLIGTAVDTDVALPFCFQKILMRLGDARPRHIARVETEGRIVGIDRCPSRLRIFVAVAIKLAFRRIVSRQQAALLEIVAVEAGAHHHIDKRFPGAEFGEDPFHQLRIGGTIKAGFNLRIKLLKTVGQSLGVGGIEGRVKHHLAFGLG